MKAEVLDLEGRKTESIELPPQFAERVRPDLVRRAFHAQVSLTLQPKGVFPLAGMQTSAEYFGRRHRPRQGINVGRSRLPREKLSGMRLGRVRMVPHSVKGRRAHPPKPEKELVEKINRKEKLKAIRSAIAATVSLAQVNKRGHAYSGVLPIVVSSSFESIKKAREAEKSLGKLGVSGDLERALKGRKPRSGTRKGGHRTPVSVLIVYSKDGGISKAARNLPGVSAVHVEKLDAKALAPGGVAGRLTVWTKGAIEELASKKLYE